MLKAFGIWRSLEIKETLELADFLASWLIFLLLVVSFHDIDMARNKPGGLRAIAPLAIGGTGALEYYVRHVDVSA